MMKAAAASKTPAMVRYMQTPTLCFRAERILPIHSLDMALSNHHTSCAAASLQGLVCTVFFERQWP